MIEALLDLPPHVRERMAAALEAGLLSVAASRAELRSVLGSDDGMDAAQPALAEFQRLGLPGNASARWIRSMSMAEARAPRADLVWSGSKVPGLSARDTRRVYEEVIGSAEHTLWVSTYAFFDGPSAFEHLARRMDARPSLKATLLLNVQRRRGDVTSVEQLVRRFAERFWSVEWPGSRRPAVYFDPRALEPSGPTGVLHAKAVVADEETVFITSANLTDAALDQNIELGLFIRDRALAASVTCHFRGLVDQKLVAPLPAA